MDPRPFGSIVLYFQSSLIPDTSVIYIICTCTSYEVLNTDCLRRNNSLDIIQADDTQTHCNTQVCPRNLYFGNPSEVSTQ